MVGNDVSERDLQINRNKGPTGSQWVFGKGFDRGDLPAHGVFLQASATVPAVGPAGRFYVPRAGKASLAQSLRDAKPGTRKKGRMPRQSASTE